MSKFLKKPYIWEVNCNLFTLLTEQLAVFFQMKEETEIKPETAAIYQMIYYKQRALTQYKEQASALPCRQKSPIVNISFKYP